MAHRPWILSGLPHDVHAHAVQWVLARQGVEARWLRSWADASPGIACDASSGLTLRCDAPSSVWYRRPRAPRDLPGTHPADAEFLQGEWRRYVDNLEACAEGLPGIFWANRPDRARHVENKLVQLAAARRCDLVFPATLVSSDPDAIRAFATRHGPVVYKPFQTHSWQDGDGRIFSSYARVVDDALLADDASLRLCPGIFQACVDKAHDLRVTVVGDHLFPVRIDAAGASDALDWRADSLAGGVTMRATALPAPVGVRLRRLFADLGIVYGSVDFAVDRAGDAHFLEVNQAGQFLFVEEAEPAVPILQAMAAMLAQGRTDYTFAPDPALSYAAYVASAEHRDWWDHVSDGIRGGDGGIPGVSRE